MKAKNSQKPKLPVDKEIIREAHQERDEFNETRKTITDLVNYRRSLLSPEAVNLDKLNEIKDKAIDAINHFFDEETEPGKS